jgi:flavorubredoxin
MAANKALKAWANMAQNLDIELIAPQHGAFFKGKNMVKRFIDWCAELQCGVDLISNLYKLPSA